MPTAPGGLVTFGSGKAHVALGGAAHGVLDLSLSEGMYLPGQVFQFVWGTTLNKGTFALLGGLSPDPTVGSRKTSAGLAVLVSLNDEGRYLSRADECTVVLTQVDQTGLRGTLRCSRIPLAIPPGAALDATGSFTAAR